MMAGESAAKHGRARSESWYLKYARAEHFGDFSQRTLGPLGPHLNVVFGKNEAGKTSFVNLISGVMFGWEDGRTAKNTYRPVDAERCGTLTFEKTSSWQSESQREEDVPRGQDPEKGAVHESVAQISRVRNADGLKGDAWLLSDIEKETYRETFNLNSDKLMSMNDVENVTNRLLTASSGTPTAPAAAREDLERKIAEFTSKSAKYPHSIARLKRQQEDLHERINKLLEDQPALLEDNDRLNQLILQSEEDQVELIEVSERIEKLVSAAEIMRPVNDRLAELAYDRDRRENRQLPQFESEDFSDVPEALLYVTNREDESLRARVEALGERLEASRAEEREAEKDFDRLEEELLQVRQSDKEQALSRREAKQAVRQAVLYGVTTLVFIIFGIVFSQISSGQGSMGLSAITVAMLVCAVMFLGLFATRVVVAVKAKKAVGPAGVGQRHERALERRVEQSQASFEQVQDACREERRLISEELESLGLAAAQGSPSEALLLLDRARNARLQKRLEDHVDEVAKDIAFYEEELAKCDAQRKGILEECGIHDVDAQSVEKARREASMRRQELQRSIESASREIGRLEQKLRDSNASKTLDALRLELQQVNTRMGESMSQLAQMLIAKKALDAAITQWEKTSQPEVIDEAGRILSELTHKAWTAIRINEAGEVEVLDRYGRKRPTRLLSTATCQQAYISLRLALLETAAFVGRNVPVMCDDILVHFDWSRRAETARFLARLARSRQVIMFTCHEEVVELLTRVDPGCTRINL